MNKMNKFKTMIALILIGSCFFSWWLLRPNLLEENVKTNHESLVISSSGKILNFNLENNEIQWQYQSKFNLSGNRNYFSLSEDILLQPFESGELIAFNLNTGKILWQEHIFGEGNGMGVSVATPDGIDLDFVNSLKPLFMTQPLMTKENVYIASTNQPMSTNIPALYSFEKNTGKKNWVQNLPTVFNFFKPVEFNDFIFVNSAVFLNLYDKRNGDQKNYGTYILSTDDENTKPNQFSNPIYVQMLRDGKSLFIGDENGKFYALEFDGNNNISGAVASDPENTFIKNSKLFKWTFSDDAISSIHADGRAHLYKNYLLTAVNLSDKTEQSIIAINKKNGKLIWKTDLQGIDKWALIDDKIIASNREKIYLLDMDGKITDKIKIPSEFAVISNIEIDKNGDFYYATEKGIVKLEMKTQKINLVLKHNFIKDEHDYFQIKYLKKNIGSSL